MLLATPAGEWLTRHPTRQGVPLSRDA